MYFQYIQCVCFRDKMCMFQRYEMCMFQIYEMCMFQRYEMCMFQRDKMSAAPPGGRRSTGRAASGLAFVARVLPENDIFDPGATAFTLFFQPQALFFEILEVSYFRGYKYNVISGVLTYLGASRMKNCCLQLDS